jgi:RNase P subunit RPR2
MVENRDNTLMVLVKAAGGMTNAQLAESAQLASSFAGASPYAIEKYVDRWVRREIDNGTILKEGRKIIPVSMKHRLSGTILKERNGVICRYCFNTIDLTKATSWQRVHSKIFHRIMNTENLFHVKCYHCGEEGRYDYNTEVHPIE